MGKLCSLIGSVVILTVTITKENAAQYTFAYSIEAICYTSTLLKKKRKMKKGIRGFLLIGMFSLVACSIGSSVDDLKTAADDAARRRSKTTSTTPPSTTSSTPTSTSDIYFQTDFSNVTLSPHSNYIAFNPYNLGIPSNLTSECDLGFAGTIPTYANAQIVSDNNRNVLKGILYGDDPSAGGVTRFQMDILTQSNLDLPVYHISQRMFLNPDLAYLSQFPNAINEFGTKDWTILFEMWNQSNSSWDGDVGGSARWDLSLAKDAGTNNLYWELSAEYMQPAALEFHSMWTPISNKTVAVPFGQWFTLDFYMKRGEGTAGQLVVSIQPDGGTQQVIFNTSNSTIYPGHSELYLHRISPFKLYMSPDIMNFMHNAGKNMDILYNDFKWYVN
jgi:hypothetical protein